MSVSYPYDTKALAALHDEDRWGTIPYRTLDSRQLKPTQPAVVINRIIELANGAEPETGDRHLHVVAHHGALHIHDGHHRWLIANIYGDPVTARVVNENGHAV